MSRSDKLRNLEQRATTDFDALWRERDLRLREAIEAKSNEMTLAGNGRSTALLREHVWLYAQALHEATNSFLDVVASLLPQLGLRPNDALVAAIKTTAIAIISRHAADYSERVARQAELMGLAGKQPSLDDTQSSLSQNLLRCAGQTVDAYRAQTAKVPLIHSTFGYFLVTVIASLVVGLLLFVLLGGK